MGFNWVLLGLLKRSDIASSKELVTSCLWSSLFLPSTLLVVIFKICCEGFLNFPNNASSHFHCLNIGMFSEILRGYRLFHLSIAFPYHLLPLVFISSQLIFVISDSYWSLSHFSWSPET